MKHFLVELTYLAPIEKIEEVLQEHRNFLQTGYDQNILLMSGPKNPREGGIIIAKEESMEKIQEFFKLDPYNKNNYADYKFVEFNPVKSQSFLKDWI